MKWSKKKNKINSLNPGRARKNWHAHCNKNGCRKTYAADRANECVNMCEMYSYHPPLNKRLGLKINGNILWLNGHCTRRIICAFVNPLVLSVDSKGVFACVGMWVHCAIFFALFLLVSRSKYIHSANSCHYTVI